MDTFKILKKQAISTLRAALDVYEASDLHASNFKLLDAAIKVLEDARNVEACSLLNESMNPRP